MYWPHIKKKVSYCLIIIKFFFYQFKKKKKKKFVLNSLQNRGVGGILFFKIGKIVI